MKKTAILTSEDIKKLVDTFYEKVGNDELLSPIFVDIAKVNWKEHLPKMYAFWGSLLLGEGQYKGNPFKEHIPLPIDNHHFDRWIYLFEETINENFIGEKANEALSRAKSIAYIFETKLKHIHNQ